VQAREMLTRVVSFPGLKRIEIFASGWASSSAVKDGALFRPSGVCKNAPGSSHATCWPHERSWETGKSSLTAWSSRAIARGSLSLLPAQYRCAEPTRRYPNQTVKDGGQMALVDEAGVLRNQSRGLKRIMARVAQFILSTSLGVHARS
jgi:hypothetical protein